MRFTQSEMDNLGVRPDQRGQKFFHTELVGFGIKRTKTGKAVYIVQYERGGRVVEKKLGKTTKITLNDALKKALKKLPSRTGFLQQTKPRKVRLKPPPVVPPTESHTPSREKLSKEKKPRRLLIFPELKATRGIKYTRRNIDRLEALGKFPKRVKIGGNAVAWVESEIDEFVERAIAARPRALIGGDRK